MNVKGMSRYLSPRTAVAGLELVLAAAIAALLVLIALKLVTPVGPLGARALAPDAAMPQRRVASSDIFWASNRTVATSSGPWLLHGISFASGDRHAYAIVSKGKGQEQVVVREGEAFGDGAQLEDVGVDFIVYQDGGKSRRIYLDDAPAPPPAAQTQSQRRQAAQGFVLPGPFNSQLLTKFGFLPGDKVLYVEGKQVASAQDVRTLLLSRRDSASVRVTFARDNDIIEKVLK